jgi:hypothetical protein
MAPRNIHLMLAVVIAAAMALAPAALAVDGYEFTDWTAVSNNTATGTLLGQSISLSGTHVWDTPTSVLDGSWTAFTGPDFTPPLPATDMIQISGSSPADAYTLQFGAPVTNPVLEIGSLGSSLDFAAGTQITRITGDSGFSVSGSSVTGTQSDALGADGINDSNGTVALIGTFSSISFTATYPIPIEDGILLQVGAVPPTQPPVQPVARMSVSPNPTCVDVPTTLDATASTSSAPITRYRFAYYERDAFGQAVTTETVLADSASPVATVRFPWDREQSIGTFSFGRPSVWVRDPAVVTLTITDATGATASTTETVAFAQTTTTQTAAGCPGAGTTPNPTPPVVTSAGATGATANAVLVAARCKLGGLPCAGDFVYSSPSLAEEGERLLLQRELEKLNEEIEELQANIAGDNATAHERAQQAAATENISEKQLLIVLAKVALQEASLARADLKAAEAKRDHVRQLLNGLEAKLAAPARARHHHAVVAAAVPFRLAPGERATLRAPLIAPARRLLRRYHLLHLTLYTYTLTDAGERIVTSRNVVLHTAHPHNPGR